MRRQWIGGLLISLVLAGCSSGDGGSPVDTRPPPRPDTNSTVEDAGVPDVSIVDAPVLPIDSSPDPACDEDAMGENYCIINSPGGNGTPVTRQTPPPYQSCRL